MSEQGKLIDVLNGRTLCKDCHAKTDTYAGKANNSKSIEYVLSEVNQMFS